MRLFQKTDRHVLKWLKGPRDFSFIEQSLSIRTLFINTWDKDFRSSEEKRKTPTILDIGWAEYNASSLLSGDFTVEVASPTAAQHIILQEKDMFQLRKSKRSVSLLCTVNFPYNL